MDKLIIRAEYQSASALKDNIWARLLPWLIALLSLSVGLVATEGWHIRLDIPMFYQGDGLLTLSLIKRVMENPWIFHSDRLGFPFGASLYDYPVPDSGSLLILKALGIATHSAATAYNLYYLIGFPLDALAAYFVLGKFGVSRTFRAVGAFAFAILPFHFMRIGHLFYTWYFAAPIFALLAYGIARGQAIGFPSKRPWIRWSLYCLGLLALSCFGVYYSFFGVITVLAGGALGTARTRTCTPMARSLIVTAIIGIGIALNVAPNVADRFAHGINPETAQRSAAESEIYGLKIAEIVLPHQGHRFSPFEKLSEHYATTFPLVNENVTSANGLIAAVGLAALLLLAIIPKRRDDGIDPMPFLASITLVLILFCTIGGLSTLFSMIVSPMIRAWNRASVFIGFTTICAAMLLLDRWLRGRRVRGISMLATGVALIVFACWDQTSPRCAPCAQSSKGEFESDVRFVSAIESRLPRGSAVYQLPYMAFPEVPPLNRLQAYDQARGYLHSSSLRWSYGLIKGRAGDLFFRKLAEEPLQRQIEVLRKLGFNGLYVDRRGYADGGAAIESEIARVLGQRPALVSDNNLQSFFDLRSGGASNPMPPSGLTNRQLMNRAGFVVDQLGLRYDATPAEGIDFRRREVANCLSDISGLSIAENWGRWSDADFIKLTFIEPLPRHFILHIRAQAFGPNVGQRTRITIGKETETFTPSASMHDFSLHFDRPGPSTAIQIQPPTPISPRDLGMSEDNRKLGIGLQLLRIEASPQG